MAAIDTAARRRRRTLLALGAALLALSVAAPAQAIVIPDDVPLHGETDTIPPILFTPGPDCVYSPSTFAVPRFLQVTWTGSFSTCPLAFGDGLEQASAAGAIFRVMNDAAKVDFWAANRPLSGGTVYVIGPRAVLTAKAPDPDWTKPVTFDLDASGSYVVDYLKPIPPDTTTRRIIGLKDYAFDLDGDGQFDTTAGTGTTAQITLPGPGVYSAGVRVTDELGRTDDQFVSIDFPKPVFGVPTVAPLTPDQSGTKKSTVGVVTTAKRRIKITAAASARRGSLRSKGYVVKVSGLQAGDRVTATLRAGKKRAGSRVSTGDGISLKRTLRVRLSSGGKRLVKPKKTKLLQLTITVSGRDGYALKRVKRVKLR